MTVAHPVRNYPYPKMSAIHLPLRLNPSFRILLLWGTLVCGGLRGQDAQIWQKYTGQIADPNIPMLPDYSFAGYKLGNEPIPQDHGHTVFDVTTYGAVANDSRSDHTAIQNAIDAAELNGGGVVFFPPGEFVLNEHTGNETSLTINSSNVVLKGSGSTPGGTIINMKNHMFLPGGTPLYAGPPMIDFSPENTATPTVTNIAQNASRGDKVISVDDASIFSNEKFVRFIMASNTAANSTYLEGKTPRTQWTRINTDGINLSEIHEIESVDTLANTVTIKDPIMDDIDVSWGWTAQTHEMLENCGFEDIHFKANFTDIFDHHKDYIHDSGWTPLIMTRVANSWVRRIRFSNVSTGPQMKLSYASSMLILLVDGNAGHYLAKIGGSSRVLQGLIWDNTSAGQWHGTDISSRATGCVSWRIHAPQSRGFDMHGNFPRNNLIDLYTSSGLSGQGGGVGSLPHHLKGLTIWNQQVLGDPLSNVDLWADCGSTYCGLAVVNPILVGHHGSAVSFLQANVKYEESNGSAVSPVSLYEAQLEDSIGSRPAWMNMALNEYAFLEQAWYAASSSSSLPAEADAHVRSGTYADTNYGSTTGLEVRDPVGVGNYNRKTFLRFDLSSISTPVTGAKLRLVPNGTLTDSYTLREIADDSWSEGGITWNTSPAEGTSLGQKTGNGSAPLEWDVTAWVENERTGDGSLSLAVVSETDNSIYSRFHSREAGAEENRPVLVYTTTPTLSLGAEADAFVRSGVNGDTVYGSSPWLEVKDPSIVGDYSRKTLLRFDLSLISLPVTSAKLRLVPNGTLTDSYTLGHVTDDSWSETSVTWNNSPSEGANIAHEGGAGGGPIEWDVTHQVETERLGDGSISLVVKSETDAAIYSRFHSKDSSTAGSRPMLILSTTPRVELGSVDDAFVRSGTNGDNNYGSSPWLEVVDYAVNGNYNRKSLLRFDLSTVSLPVSSAKLRLITDGTLTDTYLLRQVSDDSWNETGVTWNSSPVEGTLIAQQAGGGANLLEWDVTDYVESEREDPDGISFAVTSESDNGVYSRFRSKDSGVEEDRPELVILTTPVIELGAEADARVRSGVHADTNYGTSAWMVVSDHAATGDYNRKTFLRFDLSSITSPIVDAKLRLVPNGSLTDAYTLRGVTDDSWSESAITWNSSPTEGSVLSVESGTGSAPIEWDVSIQAETERNGDGSMSLAVISDTDNGIYSRFHTKESSSTGSRPVLVITVAEQ